MKKYILLICIVILSISSILGCNTTVKLGSVSGVVTLDGTPSSDITVSISGTSESTTTDSNGSYSLTGISQGNIILSFTKSGYSNGSTTITVVGGSDTTVPTVNLSSSYGSISGTARLEGETDYSGITVAISGTSSSTTTDTLGSYLFSNLAAGNVTLVFSKSGYDSATVNATVSSGQNTSVSVVTLQIAKGNLAGTVNLFGESDHSGITVSIDNTQLSATTLSDGSFTISNATSGTYSLTITKSLYTTETTSNIVVTGGQSTNIGTIYIYQEATIVNQYNLSSTITGDVLSMESCGGYLFIATSSQIYKLPTNSPTSITKQITVTHNFYSMDVWGDSVNGIIECYAPLNPSSSPTGEIYFAYDINTLTLPGPDGIGELPTFNVPVATTLVDTSNTISYSPESISFIKLHFTLISTGNYSFELAASYPVNETGIVSLSSNELRSNYYACNSTNIYKYTNTFSSVSARGLGTSNLVGIAFDGTYIWAIDATTKKLYKITDF